MQRLIHNKPISRFTPQLLPHNFLWKSHGFLRIHPQKCNRNCATLTLCSFASTQSLSLGGWDDFQFSGDSVHSGESNQFHNFLNSLGVGDKKYAFVYLFGFVCALAISRVRVSSIVVFPACAIVFSLGFSVGLAKGGHWKELRLNGNRKKFIDDNLRGSIEKMRNLGDNLKEYNGKVVNLKNDITRGIECNEVTVGDLEGYVDVMESTSTSFQKAMNEVESCIQNVLVHSQGKEGSSEHKSVQSRKNLGENGFNFPQYFEDLFRGRFNGSNADKNEFMGVEVSNRKLDNILTPPVRDGNLNYAQSGNIGSKSAVRAQNGAVNYMDGIGMGDIALENEKGNVVDTNDFSDTVFDQTNFNYQNKASRVVNNWHVKDELDTVASHNDSYDSVDFSIIMNHTKTAASFGHQQKRKSLNRNYTQFESIEEDRRMSQKFSYKREDFNTRKRPSFGRKNLAQENALGSSPSSLLDEDLEFNRYLVEANNLLNEAKDCLTHKVDDVNTEHSLHESAVLLSKAIDLRPMSLLAVGQLGNTYLLHGELKLRTSRELRSQIVRAHSSSVDKMKRPRNRFGNKLGNRDKIIPILMNVCEECEELLIKAGRTYKMALSIDGNDIRALYNWGLALSFRAQLIADIGPTAARDADKVFLAAIEKFDAMMSKSNDYLPDALFRWGTALQHRSRLRPSRSREKATLLQQARQLYKDALDMDSGNIQLREALSSCISELDHWQS